MTPPAAALPPPPPPVAPPPPGDARPVVPDHEIFRRIGRGSYGDIWLARALATGAWRAVKIVWRDSFESERSFRREFEGLSAFEPISRSHAGFVDILQVGRNDARGFFYYVMELADDHATGRPVADPAAYIPRTLRAVLQSQRRLWTPECLALGTSLAAALDALHAHGLSHRDIKPDNIIFVGGEPKLADIGLVAAHGQRSYVGTEGYVPPEGPGGVSADLYSLGKVLYEASMGRDRLDFPAFASDLEALGPDHGPLLRGLNGVLLRACDPRPPRRYASARDLGTDLRRLRDGKSPRRGGWGWPGWFVPLAVAALALVWTLRHHRPLPDRRATVKSLVPPAPVAPKPAETPLPPPTGSARIESEPSGAAVHLGERELGVTPLTVPDLPPGPTVFTFTHPGFRRRTAETTVAAGQTAAVQATLPPGRAPRPDGPWENSLGMRFLPLDGGVLLSGWKTRVRDFAAFAWESGYDATGGMSSFRDGADTQLGATWQTPGFPQTPDHPVVGVSWKDAYAFCDWLTEREHASGDLDEDQAYRLPTDLEWSRAAGLPPETGATPQARSGQIKSVYPWGAQWPPPPGAGNYAGAELRAPDADWPANLPTIPGGFTDGFPRTSPVGSFAPDARGFSDLGGNAWEWCEDRFAPGGESRVLRGGSWGNVRADLLLSGKRIDAFPNTRSDLYGFRVVLETVHPPLASVRGPQAGQAWENGLGMRFAPVGGTLLFSVWTTRVEDYERFCRETGRTVPTVDFVQGPTHPAVDVSRLDAEAFCGWLTARELASGHLRAGQSYRLPTDREWSLAAGLPDEQGDTPEARDGRVRGFYPWGKVWPPPANAGNFAASETAAGSKRVRRRVTPAGEAYTQTAPVGSFAPNASGLYDMAGNVWQWCGDNYKKNGALRHWGVLRGGSWADYGPSILQSSYRNVVPSGERDVIYGFRCVLDLQTEKR